MVYSNKSISPLRQRMIEDMTLRKLSPKTQIAYIRAVVKLTRFLLAYLPIPQHQKTYVCFNCT